MSENKSKAMAIIERFERMQSVRSNWDSIWQFIAKRTDPKNACFTYERAPGDVDSGWQKFDSTASLAIPRWAAAIDGLTTPKTQKWHGLTVNDTYLNKKYKLWLEEARDTLFARRYAANSNFTNANFENLKTIGTFGSGPFSLTENYSGGNIYKAWPIREFYVEQSFNGNIDVFFRNFTLNVRQARQIFGEECPAKIKSEKDLGKTFDFIHAVYPNTDYDKKSLLASKKKYASKVVCSTLCELVEESGFDICPFFYPRYDIMPSLQDAYGYSPVLLCMPEIRDLNAMIANCLKVADRVGNPTILLTEDDLLEQRSFANGVVVPGGLDANNNQRAKVLELPANLPFTLEWIQDFRNVINEGFNLNLFQILINKPDMTATEVLQRAQEQATLLTPTTSRREKEFLGPLIKKELEIAFKQNALPPMPEELQEALGSGQVYLSVEYDSPIRRAQKADDGVSITRTLEATAFLAQFDPTVKNKINATRTLELLGEVWGAPQKMFATEEEKQEKDISDAEQMQAQQMLAAAPAISKSAKDLAEAQNSGGLKGIL